MKVVFDSSALISVSQTCLINILGGLKEKMNAEFLIPQVVFNEAVQRPIEIKRFELNAIRIKKAIDQGWFRVAKVEDKTFFDEVEGLANNCFFIKGNAVRLLQAGEIEALAIIREQKAEALAIDERTTRMLIENPKQLQAIMQARKNRQISIDAKKARLFGGMFQGLSVVRSVELIALAHEFGILGEELPKGPQSLEAALFAAKYSGCAVSSREINIFLHGKR